MDLEAAINYALEGEALLFAGSGFSYGAKNINGSSFNVGDGLREVIAKDCGVDSTRPLSVISEFYISEKSVDELIALIKGEFTSSDIAPWHKKLLSLPWKRIYTTNYDSIIELAAEKNCRKLTPIVLSDKIHDSDIDNACIHLNGHIDHLNRNTINNEFKLIDTSYSCDALDGNGWFELFKDDLQTARVIIIIGYSMQFDIDIKRLLSAPVIHEKVIFINDPSPEIIDKRLLERYGHCEFIGIEKFSNDVDSQQKSFTPPVYEKKYKSFVHEYRATLSPSNLSFSDINAFFTKGEFKEALLSKHYGEYKYMVLRQAVDFVMRDYLNRKVFLAISDLGNGKTMFCQLVRNELREHEVDVFTFSHDYNSTQEEVERICSNRKRHSVVIIDDYKNSLSVLKKFKFKNKNKVTFVLTTRRSIDPNYKALPPTLGIEEKDIRTLFLDTLQNNETASLSCVIENNSLYNSQMKDRSPKGIEEYIQSECHSHFADLLLEAYKSSDIKERISRIWEESSDEPIAIKNLAILGLMKSVMGITFNFSEMLSILKIDYSILIESQNTLLKEFFNFETDDIVIKSSIVATELLRSAIGLDNLINTMKTIIFEADRAYKTNGAYLELLKNLISHSHFILFESTSDNQNAILSFYNDIRNSEFCRNNVFYWEQFSSACIGTRNFSTALQCIENAFTLAKEKPNFVPFHIENIKANYLIEKLLFDSTSKSADDAINILIECHSLLMKNFNHPDNNINYTFKVGAKYTKLFEIYKDSFDYRQKSIFIEKKVEMIKLMKTHQEISESVDPRLSVWINDLTACI